MRIEAWLAAFKPLHQRAVAGLLSVTEYQEYRTLRADMTKSILGPENAKYRPGQPLRQLIRIAQVFQVDLDVAGLRQRVMTNSISAGGFSGLLHHDPGKLPVGFSLRLPRNSKPVSGRVKTVGAQRRGATYLVSFAFMDVPLEERDRVETFIFDTVMKRFDGG
jgi:hypothetical protein